MAYDSVSVVLRAGPASEYGGNGHGAVFVWLRDTEANPPRHDAYFEIPLPWANQGLAVALAAITSGKRTLTRVGQIGNPSESNSQGDPICYRLLLLAE